MGRVTDFGGQVLEGSMVDHTEQDVQEGTQHRWIFGKLVNEGSRVVCKPGGEVRSEASIVDVKSSLMGELRGVEWSSIVLEESLEGAVDAVIEKKETQHGVRSLDAYAECVYSATSDPGSAILTWTVEIVGRVVSRSQSGERRKRQRCRKA